MTHIPVMTAEVLQYLRPEQGGLFVDCTIGLGGHSRALLEAGASRIIGLDRDLDALARARETLAPWGDRVELVHADYRAIDDVLAARNWMVEAHANVDPQRVDVSVVEHLVICDALLRGDADEAAARTAEHLAKSVETIFRNLASAPGGGLELV